MRAARPGVREYEIEALIDYTFRRSGGHPGYGTIVGGGVNATILHYVDNSEPLAAGQLLLVDAGCELDGFTADVTRTYPIGGRFSPMQRRAYELVLDVEKRCIALIRPGATIDEIHAYAVERLTAGMVELGLLHGEPAALIASGAYRRFYMHRTSHWLGLDVHDVGAYAVDGQPRPLEAGMVLTVEPGLYVPDAADVPEPLRAIGIRIEDDVLVTADGYEVLTAAIPKEPLELEALTQA
jgi:Xaa-Pro aminopeptidase